MSDESKIVAYNGWLVPSLKYKVVLTTMSYEQCEEINKILAPALLNFFRIARTCARVVLNSSFHLAGLNIYHLYQLQGFEKLKLFLWHVMFMDTTGTLLTMSQYYTQLELGIGKPFLEMSYEKYQHLITPMWITSIWEYIGKCKTKIKHVDEYVYKPLRKGDRFIMDAVIESGMSSERASIINPGT